MDADFSFSPGDPDLLPAAWAFINMEFPALLKFKTPFPKCFRDTKPDALKFLIFFETLSDILRKHAEIAQNQENQPYRVQKPAPAEKNRL